MARHSIKSFNVSTNASGDAVDVEIITELKKPYRFNLRPDVHYPTVQDIDEKLNVALSHCVAHYQKADFNILPERSYISINVKNFIDTRFTGDQV
jgi:hypothetical protein